MSPAATGGVRVLGASRLTGITQHDRQVSEGGVRYAVCVRSRWWSLVRAMAVVLVVAGAYGLVRFKRAELVDFVVPRTAAARLLQQDDHARQHLRAGPQPIRVEPSLTKKARTKLSVDDRRSKHHHGEHAAAG